MYTAAISTSSRKESDTPSTQGTASNLAEIWCTLTSTHLQKQRARYDAAPLKSGLLEGMERDCLRSQPRRGLRHHCNLEHDVPCFVSDGQAKIAQQAVLRQQNLNSNCDSPVVGGVA